MVKIKVILGTTRQRRFGDKAAYWIAEEARACPDVDVELLDYPLPFFDEPLSPAWGKGQYANADIQRWADRVADGDAFIMVAPEYNHG
jgi:NAD(P)H-dependent FMN reductase